jgi:hypothetical protein
VNKQQNEVFELSNKMQGIALALFAIGVIAFVASFLHSEARTWVSYLVNVFYLVSLGLAGTFFLSLQSLAKTGWMVPFKRILEAMSSFLPVGFVLMILLFFGIHTIYEWSHPGIMEHDALLQKKAAYLNTPFFMVRIVILFVIWITFSKIIVKLSRKLDSGTGGAAVIVKLSRISAIFMVLFGLTYSVASFDWIMSVEPHWFSTIFALYTFSGLFVSAIAFITISLIVLQSWGYFKGVINENHYHDLGKFMFGFSTFWAYIWFSQYLLIWYSNIPEETEYFLLRFHHDWSWLFYFNFAFNWLVPFLVLMPRSSKRNKRVLLVVSGLLLVGHWIDLYVMIAPKIFAHFKIHSVAISLYDIPIALGFAALFLLVVMRALRNSNLLPKQDPYYQEAVHLHQ